MTSLDWLRDKLARQYNPVVVVHIEDCQDIRRSRVFSKYLEDAIVMLDPFQKISEETQ